MMMLSDPFFNGTFDIDRQINKQFWSTPFFARNQAAFDRRIANMEKQLSDLKQQKEDMINSSQDGLNPNAQAWTPLVSSSVTEQYYSDFQGQPFHMRTRTHNGTQLIEQYHRDQYTRSFRPNFISYWTPATDENVSQFEEAWGTEQQYPLIS